MLARQRLRNAFKVSTIVAIGYFFLVASNQPANLALAQITGGGSSRIFMQFGDVKGSSTDEKHKDWIELRSCQWGASHTAAPSGPRLTREREVVSVTDVTITKGFDVSSPALVQDVLKSKDVKVVIEFMSAGERLTKPFLKITLEGANIATYSISAAGERPTESMTLNFDKIIFAADDTNKASYDVPQRK